MALHYNLAKVYAISENDDEFAKQIATLFVTEVPQEMELVKTGIETKKYDQAHAAAHKIKPTLDLLGMDNAYEEVKLIEAWAKRKGKRREIKDTFKDLSVRVDKAVREIMKDFSL
ncbi:MULTISPECIES: Hpt domain-containing protein [Flavobacterium]|uniref:Histidine kinase n=1 Tax=Flavobacterium aurantiibacter TaxID=2023067 RepID=A0A255ZVT8_9FLAO|nr:MULTISPECIES: Hpt domain-containing protein [Flavobacterium]OYQ45593.1 histidine kinase [Flavobacterium aurantiibacter]